MAKYKGKANTQPSDDDEEEPLTHTLGDLHHAVPNPASRYTAAQITEGTIVLVDREQARAPNTPPTTCRYCLEGAINRGPCPHGTFASDQGSHSRPYDARPAPPYDARDDTSSSEPRGSSSRRSTVSDSSAELWEANTPNATFFDGNRSALAAQSSASYPLSQASLLTSPGNSTPYPSNPSSPAPSLVSVPPCRWGHRHSTWETSRRCNARTNTSSSSSSSTITAETVRPSRWDASTVIPSRLRPSEHAEATSSPSASYPDSQTQTSTYPASSRMTTTGYDWFGVRSSASRPNAGAVPARTSSHNVVSDATSASPSRPHVAQTIPTAASPSRPYVAEIDPYDPMVTAWYVVTVGSRVGVFGQQFVATDATFRVSGQHYRHYASYEEALRAFRAAEAAGVVHQRNPKY